MIQAELEKQVQTHPPLRLEVNNYLMKQNTNRESNFID